jgi:hypothetical protein
MGAMYGRKPCVVDCREFVGHLLALIALEKEKVRQKMSDLRF